MYSVPEAVGPWAAAAASVAPPLEITGSRHWSSRRQGICLRGLLRFRGTRHVELNKLRKLNEEIERKGPKRLLVNYNAFENDCLKIQFPTNEMQIKLNEKKKIELKTNNGPRKERALLSSWFAAPSSGFGYQVRMISKLIHSSKFCILVRFLSWFL